MKYSGLIGNENCEIKEEDGSLPACYVILPTNCKITFNSKKFMGLQMSPEPCKGNEYGSRRLPFILYNKSNSCFRI